MTMMMKYLFFILFLSFCGLFQGKAFSAQDLRLAFMGSIESMGHHLQLIQDQEGMERAHQEFDQIVQQKISLFHEKYNAFFSSMSETHAHSILAHMESSCEKVSLLLKDPSLTSLEKLKKIHMLLLLEKMTKDTMRLKAEALNVGYEKIFQNLADVFRSRARFDYDDERPGFIFLSTFLFLTIVEFLVIIPPPASYGAALIPIALLGWLMWDYFFSPEEKASDYILPPDDFNLYPLIPR